MGNVSGLVGADASLAVLAFVCAGAKTVQFCAPFGGLGKWKDRNGWVSVAVCG